MIIASYFRSSFGRLRTNSCSKYSFPWTTSESRCLTSLHQNPHFWRGIGTECWLREKRPLPESYMDSVDRAWLREFDAALVKLFAIDHQMAGMDDEEISRYAALLTLEEIGSEPRRATGGK